MAKKLIRSTRWVDFIDFLESAKASLEHVFSALELVACSKSKFVASEQLSLVWRNSAQMMQPLALTE